MPHRFAYYDRTGLLVATIPTNSPSIINVLQLRVNWPTLTRVLIQHQRGTTWATLVTIEL